MRFYTNVTQRSGKFLVRGYENGKRFTNYENFNPTLFVSSSEPTKYKTLDGKYVQSIQPGNPDECKEFINRYNDVDNFEVYGMDNYIFQFISDRYPEQNIEYDISKIKLYTIDIEVSAEYGFPNPLDCAEEILAITIQDYNSKRLTTFGVFPYNNSRDDVDYILCDDELDLAHKFLNFWSNDYPDIITNWNGSNYDLPYIVGRFEKILGEKLTKKLSPWGIILKKELEFSGKTAVSCELVGITNLDYLELYKKFTYVTQENYSLNHIAEVELGEKKLDHTEYETFKEFYQNDWQKFIDYNIQDTILVDKLEQKLKLIELSVMMAFNAKVNFADVFFQVRMWDAIVYNYLKQRNIAIPPRERFDKDQKFAGAYVKDTKPGLYEWILTLDLNSLYPHLMMQFNISPETLVKERNRDISIEKVLNREFDNTIYANYSNCPNGALYRKDFEGFLPNLLKDMYNERNFYKNKMIEEKKRLEKIEEELKRRNLI